MWEPATEPKVLPRGGADRRTEGAKLRRRMQLHRGGNLGGTLLQEA